MNLLQETIEDIAESGHSAADIVLIGSSESNHRCTWAEFELLANFEYDEGFGGQEVCSDLVIAFADGSWLERGEYDGSEWWQFKRPPKKTDSPLPIRSVKVEKSGWCSISDNHKNL